MNRELVGSGYPEHGPKGPGWSCLLGLVDSRSCGAGTVKGWLVWDPWKPDTAKLWSRLKGVSSRTDIWTPLPAVHMVEHPLWSPSAVKGNTPREADGPHACWCPTSHFPSSSRLRPAGDSLSYLPQPLFQGVCSAIITKLYLFIGLGKFSGFCLKFKAISLCAWERTRMIQNVC